MTLANPVPGRIQAQDEAWLGPPTFRVTKTFAQHAPDAKGIDFGNGRCGAPVTAMDGGTCSVSRDPNGAIVVRIKHKGLHSSGYAHLSLAMVKTGQVVKKGDTIGLVGRTGADACHLHAGYTIGGREVDFWPMLNAEDDVQTTVDKILFLGADGKPEPRLVNFQPGTYIGYKLDGSKKPVTVGTTTAHARSIATITHVPDADPHGPGWLEIIDGVWVGYYLRTGPANPGVTPEPNPIIPASESASAVAAAAVTEANKYR